jgi:3-deoxy-D-manno-octulosonic-acid transferase
VKENFKTYENIHHRFLPFDIGFLMEKFIKSWRPERVFLVDSEIWTNLILIAKKNKIPIAIINARLTAKTFTKWIRFPKTAKTIFNTFDLCLTSNNETENYLKKLGAKNIFFNGNLKFINRIDSNNIKNLNEKILTSKRFWFAASTHPGEDLFCIKTHQKIKEKYKDIITIIAPRHIDKSKDIKTLAESLNLKTQILNKDELILSNAEIIIINSFGILQNYFKYAKSVFIGKSVLKKLQAEGGQNPIDAAKLKCKIYHGPYVYNFEEIYGILEKNGTAHKINNFQELSDNLIEDLRNHQKTDNKISDNIENLSQVTFTKIMKNINEFIK